MINSIICAVRRENTNASKECVVVLDSLHQQLTQILQQNQCQAYAIVPTSRSGTPGRPRYDLTMDQINNFLDLGFNWQAISSMLGIDRRTLYRHRLRLNIPSLQYTPVSDETLMLIIGQILANTPNAGETYVRGSLRSRGLRVQRWRVHQKLQELDPIGRCFRRSQTIRRRIYHVNGPNDLW